MSDEHPDQYMMIGLHKMAAQFGDGLVPELYELLTRRSRMLAESPGVVEFPFGQARLPTRETFALASHAKNNILAFPVAAEMRAAMAKKR